MTDRQLHALAAKHNTTLERIVLDWVQNKTFREKSYESSRKMVDQKTGYYPQFDIERLCKRK